MEAIELIALIYGVGYIAAYAVIRLTSGQSRDWNEVRFRVLLSLLSWSVPVGILFVALILADYKTPAKCL
tara:strand:+ start:24417 stop:24626 length:210 start_codon:yes stop_codon:yes gene_type:complete